jgi:uncharacterized protein YbjT (DUF2867 family)
MNILIVGGGGFVGRHITKALRMLGHKCVTTSRHPDPDARLPVIELDYERDYPPTFWQQHLQGIDCVINAAGILVETPGAHFNRIHHLGPCALFSACEDAKVTRVIQISAIGADEGARAPYHKSKKLADDYLRQLDLSWIILQPSLIYGHDGPASKMFRRLARLPLLPVPGKGRQLLQPVHVEDLAALVVRLVERPEIARETVAVVGPRELTYCEFLQVLRVGMGKGRARCAGQPMALMRAMARVIQHIPGGTLTPDTLNMLERGSTGDVTRFGELLGRMPRGAEKFISQPPGS